MSTNHAASPAQINAMVLNQLQTSPAVRRFRTSLGAQNATLGGQLNFNPIKTGYIIGFYIRVKLAFNATTTAYTPSQVGWTKSLSSIQYKDFSNTTRHDTTGIEMSHVLAQRMGGYVGLNGIDYVGNTPAALNNQVSNFGPTSTAATTNYEAWFYVPLAERTRGDMIGLEWAQWQQAQANLTLTLPTAAQIVGGDPQYAMLTGGTGFAGLDTTGTNTVEVFQDYYSGQVPVDAKGNPILPPISTGAMYSINSQTFTLGLFPNAKTLHALDQSWTYLSYTFLYDNGSTVFNPASSAAGTPDLAFLALYQNQQTAIYSDPPALVALHNAARLPGRESFPGLYTLDFSDRPIVGSTVGQYSIGITPLTVNNGTVARYTVETIQPTNG